jgi:hypothetical protein
VLNATFGNISAISLQPVLVVEEAGIPGENLIKVCLVVSKIHLGVLPLDITNLIINYSKDCMIHHS